MKINLSKTIAENMLALIHDANPSAASTVTLDKITVGPVQALTGDASGKNSQVTVTAKANMGYSQSVTIKYNRLGVNQGVNPLPASISIFPADTQAQRKTKVAAALGLMESQITVTAVGGGDIGLPANEDDTSVSVTVTPLANSSLYVGNPLNIQLTTPDTDIPLGNVVTVLVMNGFDPA